MADEPYTICALLTGSQFGDSLPIDRCLSINEPLQIVRACHVGLTF